MEPIALNEKVLQDAVKNEVIQIEQALGNFQVIVSEEVFISCCERRSDILHLGLANKNIQKIVLLQDFTSLVRLDLSNNIIEKIEGLEGLTNLTWFNLSFNKITKIEGLDALQKLEVLNLSFNQISVFENMDTLENLRLLFVGNNNIKKLDNVLYLSRFKKLFKLNMTGNPVSNEGDYTSFIIACLPSLTLLDNILINSEIREEAFIKYHFLLEEIKPEELQKLQTNEAQQKLEAEFKLHHDAFVEDIYGSSLFNSMFQDDPEAVKPQFLPGVAPLFQTFEDQAVELCRCFFDFGLEEHKRREAELNAFFTGQKEAEAYYRQKALKILAEFDQEHREKIAEFQNVTDPTLIEVKINSCNDAITQLQKDLLTVEFELVNNLEDNITKLDNSISDMASHFMETALKTFNQLRDLEDQYYQKVQEIIVEPQEIVAKPNVKEDIPEDRRSSTLFPDTDALMKALNTSHENHLQMINDREIHLNTQVSAWKVALFKEIQEKDVQWNHIRTSSIHRYGHYLRKQLKIYYRLR
ncbi:dynein regulatory complex subunit 3 [Nematolebias whitei]|uniref:dynein regulatory complex subunit 3 n=1 Tax=Nematolebias whitei TaxID=451745 RepID=UPI00189879B6|nr:dynein regulatory complex subunit 3 [Nematolebias whitei]